MAITITADYLQLVYMGETRYIKLPIVEAIVNGNNITITSAEGDAMLLDYAVLGYGSVETLLTALLPALKNTPLEFKYEVALGLVPESTTWNKFGYNADLDIGTEIVAAFGGTFTPLTSASTLTLVSSSANDTSAGTGARSVVVYGVNADWDSQIEVVTLNGTTPVVTTSTWLGINRVSIYLAGSGLGNAGLITVTATTGGATQATVPIGEGTSQQAIFFVQDNHTFLADFLNITAEKLAGGASPKVRFKGWVFSAVSNAKYLVFNELMDTSVENMHDIVPSQPFIIGEKSVLWFEATTDTNDTFCSCRFSGIEVSNT